MTTDGPLLLRPLTLRSLTVRNRAWVAPMCQYSAVDGVPQDWHLVHLGGLARGGAGLVITEATAVVPEGRISPADTGLWSDDQVPAWRRIVDFAHGQGAAIAVQLAHAGRKASTSVPWAGRGPVADDEGGWEPVGPGTAAYPGLRTPRSLTTDEVTDVVRAFGDAARRAVAAGFDAVEVHAAHGYLLHEFLSPLSNDRTDAYGGSYDARTRLLREVVAAVREAVGEDRPVLVRISATDHLDGGWAVEDSVRLAALLREYGVDLVDVSSGGNAPARIEVGPGYQLPLARAVRATGVTTGAVGLITDPHQAEQVLADGDADVVLLGREVLRDPHWPLRAAAALGGQVRAPEQYRAAPFTPVAARAIP